MKWYGISYPRSGANLTRYICRNLLSCWGENDPQRADKNESLIYYKTHNREDLCDKKRGLILILRNYKECILRHGMLDSYDSTVFFVTGFLADKKKRRMRSYMSYIEDYDSWPGKKFVVRYENLIKDPPDSVKYISNMLGATDGIRDVFLSGLETHYQKSIKIYRRDNETLSGGKLIVYSNNLSGAEKIAWDDFLREMNPRLFKQYLEDYTEEEI